MRYENQNAYFAATNYVFFDDTALKKQSIQSCIDMMLSGLYHSDYKILIHRRVMDILTCASKNSSSEEGCKAAATIRYLDQLIQIGFVKIVGGKGNSLTRVEDLILQYIRKNQPDQPVLVVTQRPGVAFRIMKKDNRNNQIKVRRITDQGYLGKFVAQQPFHDGVGAFFGRKWRRFTGMIKGKTGLVLLKLKGENTF